MADNKKEFLLTLIVNAVNKFDATGKAIEAQIQKLEQRMGFTSQAAVKLGNNLDNAFQRSVQRAQQLERTLTTIGSVSLGIGTMLTASGAAMVAPMAMAVKATGDFEQSMNKVKAVMDNLTAEDFDRISAKAKELGATTRYTAKDAADAFGFLAQAGYKTEQALASIDAAILLSIASYEDFASTTERLTKIIMGFGLTAEDSGRVADVLAKTSADTNASVASLAESMKFAGPVAREFGISIEQAAAIVGKLNDAGLTGEEAGTALRRVIQRLADPTKEALEVFDQLAVQIAKNADGSVNLMETMDRLAKAQMKGTDAFKIFGIYGATAAINIVRNVEAIDKLTESNMNAEGAAKRMADTIQSGFAGAMWELKSAVEAVGIALGGPLLAPLTALIQTVAGGVQWLAKFAEQHQTLAAILGGTVGVVGLVVAGLGVLALTVGALSLGAGQLTKVWAVLFDKQIKHLPFLQRLKAVFLESKTALDSETGALNTNTGAWERNAAARGRSVRNVPKGKTPTSGPESKQPSTATGAAAGIVAGGVENVGGMIESYASYKVLDIIITKLETLAGKWKIAAAAAELFNGATARIMAYLLRFGVAASAAATVATTLTAALAAFAAIAGGLGVRALYQLATDGISLSDAWGAMTDNVKQGSKEMQEAIKQGFDVRTKIEPLRPEDIAEKSVGDLLEERKQQMLALVYAQGEYRKLMGEKGGNWESDPEVKASREKITNIKNNLKLIRDEQTLRQKSPGAEAEKTEQAAVKETIEQIRAKYATLIKLHELETAAAKQAIDLELAERLAAIAATVQSEIRVQEQIEAAHRESSRRRIELVISEYEQMKQLKEAAYNAEKVALERDLEDEKKRTEARKKLAELESRYTTEAAQDAAKVSEAINQELTRQLQKRQEYLRKVRELQQQQQDSERTTAESLRQVQATAASEYDRLTMRLEDARAKLDEATELMPMFPERALQLARDAQGAFVGLARDVDSLQQNLRSNQQLVADALRSIDKTGLSGVAKWRADLQDVMTQLERARAMVEEGRTKEAESLYKQVIQQAQQIATSAPEEIRQTAKREGTGIIQQAGQELLKLNQESIQEAKDINSEVADGIAQAGELIQTEIAKQIEAVNRNIQALDKNTEALREQKEKAEKEVEQTKGAAREGVAGDTANEGSTSAPSGPSAQGETDQKRAIEETDRQIREERTVDEANRQEYAADVRRRTGESGAEAYRQTAAGPAGGGFMDMLGQALGSINDRLNTSIGGAAASIQWMPMGAVASGGAAPVTEGGTDTMGAQFVAAINKMDGLMSRFERAVDSSTDIRVTIDKSDGWD